MPRRIGERRRDRRLAHSTTALLAIGSTRRYARRGVALGARRRSTGRVAMFDATVQRQPATRGARRSAIVAMAAVGAIGLTSPSLAAPPDLPLGVSTVLYDL